MVTGAMAWTAHHGQSPSCRLMVNHLQSLLSFPAGCRAAQPCPVESFSASKKWYRAPVHPFVAWRVVHGPLKAALRMSFDPIIRQQGVLTLSNPPRLGPGSAFSSLSNPPMHCIFMTGIGYQTKQREIAFVLLPLCLFAGPTHQLVLSGEESSASLHSRWDASLPLSLTAPKALCQGPLWVDSRSSVSAQLEILCIQRCLQWREGSV